MMREDPRSPTIYVDEFAPGPSRPSRRKFFVSDELKVSRTYSLVGRLSPHADSGVQIRNKVFSDMDGGKALAFAVTENVSDEPQPWRIRYYDKVRSW